MQVHVRSEVGKLRGVLLHRPGKELESLTPQYLDSMLFEDIPFLEQMQHEHDMFAKVLQDNGCTVLYLEQLLAEVFEDERLRHEAIALLVESSPPFSQDLRRVISDHLASVGPAALASYCTCGVLKSEFDDHISHRNLSYYIRDAYPYYVSPLPNLYFTRDPATVIGNSLTINVMHTQSRRRESYLHHLVASHHHLFSDNRTISGHTEGRSIEGGDILMISPTCAAIGCSARTEVWAIEAFAHRMMKPVEEGGEGLQEVLVIQIPFTRAYMHLDTIFTMVDRDKFCIFGGVESSLRIFRMRRGMKGTLRITQPDDLSEALAGSLALPAVDIIRSGGNDPIISVREQWNDSTNTLAIAPGTVVTYRRNTVSNETLVRRGLTVIPISGSELVRGRGGPRCMSMPLWREDI
ncbi:MAG: arginine deiminase [Sphaerochaetaceae bacterium]|nr:arginine deiminase [Sphaerochaetaceae bacterium]